MDFILGLEKTVKSQRQNVSDALACDLPYSGLDLKATPPCWLLKMKRLL